MWDASYLFGAQARGYCGALAGQQNFVQKLLKYLIPKKARHSKRNLRVAGTRCCTTMNKTISCTLLALLHKSLVKTCYVEGCFDDLNA